MADKDKKPVKWDKNGNPITEAKKKGQKVKVEITRIAKANAGNIIIGGLGGAAAAGIGRGIVALVPPLRRWAAPGGFQGAMVQTGTALGVASLGLLAAAKFTSPKKAIEVAPFLLGGTAVLSLAPVLAQEIVGRIERLVIGATSTTPPQGARGPLPAGRERRVLTPQEVQLAQQMRGRAQQQQQQRRW